LILEKVNENLIQYIQKLSDEDKGHIFALMDAFLLKFKFKVTLQYNKKLPL